MGNTGKEGEEGTTEKKETKVRVGGVGEGGRERRGGREIIAECLI